MIIQIFLIKLKFLKKVYFKIFKYALLYNTYKNRFKVQKLLYFNNLFYEN